ncbi:MULTISPECIES: hypothetical protein [Paenibacillus]|uniref:DUF2007 domain-containing protein n=2 Tax=Paenibacillus TaxID=44249 RepID=A0A1R1F389_9BACL|nr:MULTISPECIES: hypothetical protein [Paenibacillus]MBJ9990182.1 hypothetical protein [Paenibacillus sp. S28]MEC0174682.1 hypothetical protein [Paenibacillus favisporus]OMF58500.1 hypothetical protein BK138_08260 [Paenibacillus rhizosphaerae]OXL82769.1 hypothetical protein BCV73_06460 [Paenibacillus sp. SSG-1]UYO03648.1 hypothetical protein K2F33_28975 [Paenibacillus sp. PSB04]
MNPAKAIWRFFFPKERILIFTSFDADSYARAKSRLLSGGIRHRSRIVSQPTGRDTFTGRGMTQYDLYVAQEDEHAARQLL